MPSNSEEKMKLDLYQIDAFAKNSFEGNPAAICPLDDWIDDSLMQKIALENNLSETAFFIEKNNLFEIRWFTPTKEVNLCGHATLASAFVIFEYLNYQKNIITFDSKSGILKVEKKDNLYQLDFPIQKIEKIDISNIIIEAFGKTPKECYISMDYIIVFEDENDILNANPNLELLKKLELDHRGIIITSTSKKYDFICRFFAPNFGVDEDPVTGSAFTQLVPYWQKAMKKNKFKAKQVSKRGGEVFCKLEEKRVKIAGYAKKYLYGQIEV